MKAMSIGQVAQKTGLRASAIRYYESIGLLPAPARTSGKRRYGDEVLLQLGVIRMAQQAGFTIAEIHMLLHDFPANTPPSVRWQKLATRKLVDINAQIQRAYVMKSLLEQALECTCSTLWECAQAAPEAETGQREVQSACGVSDMG